MAVGLNKIQVSNTNEINSSPQKVSFRGTTAPLPNDTVELSTKKKGMSNGAKIASVLGAVGVIVGGILLHKHFSAKSATEAVQQTTKELSQAVKDLVTQGRLTQKEAEMFNAIHNLEGEEFVTKAYELIAKDMGLPKYPKLVVSLEDKGMTLGHSGKDISIYIKGYERAYGKEHAKEEMINAIRHELEHYKQDLIIFLQKGDVPYFKAFAERYIDRVTVRGIQSGKQSVEDIILEETKKQGFSNITRIRTNSTGKCPNWNINTENSNISFVDDVVKKVFEEETPIATIRSIKPCEFEQLHFTQEELAKANEYLEGVRKYRSVDWLDERFLNNENFNIQAISQDACASDVFTSLAERYYNNPVEVGAIKAGETLRDKFRAFLDAIK